MSGPTAPTIRDVARLAGVSVGTASHVLNGKSHLHTPQTAARVAQAATTLAYRPNRIARSLVQRKTSTLAVVVEHSIHGRLPRNTYLVGILDGFLEAASAADYQIKLVTLVHDDPEYVASRLEDGSTDGLALLAPRREGCLLAWARRALSPIVLIGSTPSDVCLPQVDVDDESAIYDAVRWMVGLGHRRIGIITGPPSQWSAARRERGYRRALADAGIGFELAWRHEGDYTHISGRDGALALAAVRPSLSALVCGNDWVAMGAAAALEAAGVRVPGDVSVLGFDDMEIAQWSRPPLSTIHQPMDEIGRKAAEVLIATVERGRCEATLALLPGTLVHRESVGPAGDYRSSGREPAPGPPPSSPDC